MTQPLRLTLIAPLLAALLLGTLPVPAAHAATFTVNSTADVVDATPGDGVCATAVGVCTLRAAIQEANALAGDDIITVPAGTYTLTIAGAGEDGAVTGDLDITANVTINGAGASSTIIDGGALDRVFHVTGAVTVNISGITVRNGSLSGSGFGGFGGGIRNDGTLTITNSTFSGNSTAVNGGGGGIFNNGGTLTVTNSTFSGNSATYGGGIYNNGGTLTVTNSTFSGNSATASGGGIYNVGTLTITNSTFSGNSATGGNGSGGGIYNDGTLTVTNSTFSSNSAPGSGSSSGGGIYNNGPLTVTNTTFSGNSATASGGGIINVAGAATATITNSTFSGNSTTGDGGGIRQVGGTVTLRNTIVANSTAGGNCFGTITDGGNNLQFGGTVANSCGAGIPTANPQLGALTGNPQYFPLNTGSPAIDAGSNAVCAAAPVNNTSQNGVTRPTDGDGNGTATCDIGSYEAPTAAGGGGGGGDPGPLVYLAVNGGSGYEFSVANPVAVTYQLRGCQGQEMFLILNAPPMGIIWSYLNAAGQWAKLPVNLADITPFSTSGPADGGSYNLFTGSVPPGDYELYLGCDFAKNGHLDYYLGGLNGVFDHILVHVR